MPKVIHRFNIPLENIEAFAGKLNWNEINGDERWLLRMHYDGQHLPIDGSKTTSAIGTPSSSGFITSRKNSICNPRSACSGN